MEDIKRYEAMAKLNLAEDERKRISAAADVLIGSFDMLKSVETDGVEPMYTVLDVKNVLREDVAVKAFSREELLANAPAQSGGYFKVPKTIQ